MKRLTALFLCLFCIVISPCYGEELIKKPSVFDLAFKSYSYPYPVHYIELNIEQKIVHMAYMDIAPTGPDKHQTVVLMHAAYFFSAYWKDTIDFLSKNGYRVIVPDQIGFGKSEKPIIYYTFEQLAYDTKQLLDFLNIKNAIFVGHALGAEIAVRFSLLYPEMTQKLVLESPSGLEDYRHKIPYKTTDEIWHYDLNVSWKTIYDMQKNFYATWNNKYTDYVSFVYKMTLGPAFPQLAHIGALIYQMTYTQPILYDLPLIKVPTLLIVGAEDRSAPGKQFLPPDAVNTVGQIPTLAKQATKKIPHAKLLIFDNVGHVPHLEAPDKFNQALLNFIEQNKEASNPKNR